MRKERSISPEEFLKSEIPHKFRVNCSQYAEFNKFKKWILKEVEVRKVQKSYDQQVKELCGDFDIQDNFSKTYATRKTSPLFDVSRDKLYKEFSFEDFLPKEKHPNSTSKKNKKEAQWKPKSDFDLPFVPKERLGDEYIIRD